MIEAGAQKEMIPVEQSFAAWRKDPEYVKAYNAIGDEFHGRHGDRDAAADLDLAGAGEMMRPSRCFSGVVRQS